MVGMRDVGPGLPQSRMARGRQSSAVGPTGPGARPPHRSRRKGGDRGKKVGGNKSKKITVGREGGGRGPWFTQMEFELDQEKKLVLTITTVQLQNWSEGAGCGLCSIQWGILEVVGSGSAGACADLHPEDDVADLTLGEGRHVHIVLLPVVRQDQILRDAEMNEANKTKNRLRDSTGGKKKKHGKITRWKKRKRGRSLSPHPFRIVVRRKHLSC